MDDQHRWRAPAGRGLLCLTTGVLAVAGGLLAAGPGHAAKAASGNAPKAATNPSSPAEASTPAQKPAAPTQRFDIDDFAIQGAETIPQVDIEEAVYPFLGPNKT